MKQYKLTAWPDLPARFRQTTYRRVVSELSQRFCSVRDLARHSGASHRDVEELLSALQAQGQLMMREAPQTAQRGGSWRDWAPVAAVIGLVRVLR